MNYIQEKIQACYTSDNCVICVFEVCNYVSNSQNLSHMLG